MTLLGAGAALRTFEQTFTLRGRTGETMTDGYVKQTYAADQTFKAVLSPAPAEDQLAAVESGISTEGLGRLHIRLNQDALALPKVNDIVLDPDGDEWVILTILDYDNAAGVHISLVGRK